MPRIPVLTGKRGELRVLLQKLLVIWYNEPQTLLTSEYWRPAMSDPALFKWRHFEAEIILCAVRWYLRYALSYRDVEELMHDRGVSVDHTTVFRWVQRYAPELGLCCKNWSEVARAPCRALRSDH
jgi:hypothetical protein